MKKINKMLSGALAALMIFTSVPVYATSEITNENTTTMTSEELSAESISSGAETTEEISTSETATSEISEETPEIQDKPTIFVESDEDSEGTDNWELSTVFYDSTVDNGTTPLTSIDWDASDGGYDTGEERVITVQINYKNTNTTRTYNPGDVKISVPNLIYDSEQYTKFYSEIKVSANTDKGYYHSAGAFVGSSYGSTPKETQATSGLSWDFSGDYQRNSNSNIVTYKNPNQATSGGDLSNKIERYDFTNTVTFDEKTNFEGSIQITYTLYPVRELNWPHYGNVANSRSNYIPHTEEYDDTCEHVMNKTISASMTIKDQPEFQLKSSEISFSYYREYVHPWKQYEYKISQEANKISSYDGLGSNPDDYIWVKYNISENGWYNGYYPNITITDNEHSIKINVPDNCVYYAYTDKSNSLTELDSNANWYHAPGEDYYDWLDDRNSSRHQMALFVGYPKSIYNEENNNLIIENKVDMYGTYNNEDDETLLATNTVTINLSDYEFSYDGDLYGITKDSNSSRYYDIFFGKNGDQTSWNTVGFKASVTAFYTGNPMTIRYGDDYLYATDTSGEYKKLTDSDYYFSYIYFRNLKNLNGQDIDKLKYNTNLYVRYAGDTDYTLYGNVKDIIENPDDYKFYAYNYAADYYGYLRLTKDDAIVAYYFEIQDAKESICFPSSTINTIGFHINSFDIAKSGRVGNFDYLQVYFKDENGNLILQNEPDESSYVTEATKLDIATYDKSTYGTYIQRAHTYVTYKEWNVNEQADPKGYLSKTFSSVTQDSKNELFNGSFTLTQFIDGNYGQWIADNVKKDVANMNDEKFITIFEIYDLLPLGMEVTSTEENILDSFSLNGIPSFYDKDGNKAFESNNEAKEFFKQHTKIKIIKNWKSTGRDKIIIKIDFKERPLYCHPGINVSSKIFDFSINYKITYDSILTYGKTYTNYGYNNVFAIGNILKINSLVKDKEDIDEDNDTTDSISSTSRSITISQAVETLQDVQTQTASSLSNYSTGTVPAEYGKEYSYKLRVRSGKNDVTNLVIYDNIEKWAKDKDGNFIESYGKKKYWQGEFLGIDTSYAESKGYNVKVWYSENEKAGTLTEDNSWKEYSDYIDKTKVKSLAFQYLDAEGNPAVLPANSLTYVVINMKAPACILR